MNLLAKALFVVSATWMGCESAMSGACSHAKASNSDSIKEVEKVLAPQRDDLIRPFALKEAPEMWRVIQKLRGEIELVKCNAVKLEKELIEFGRNPSESSDIGRLRETLVELQDLHDRVYRKLIDAYVAAKKYHAMPSRRDYAELKRRALEDGLNEAAMTERKYDAMSQGK